MRRTLAAIVAATCLLAGCGGSSGQHRYHTPYGVAAHSPTFAIPPKGAATPPAAHVPTWEMFDSVDVGTVPRNPFAVAGYTSGLWPTYLPLRHAFPRAYAISIAISTRYHAQCLDIEPGDATPSQAGGWVRADIAAGFKRPCLYANASTMPSVLRNVAAWGYPRGRVFVWVANWTYHPGLIAGADAVQWTDHALGRNLDESTVSLPFLGIVATPAKPPVRKPKPPAHVRPHRGRPAHSRRYRLVAAIKRHRCTTSPTPRRYAHACRVWRGELKRA